MEKISNERFALATILMEKIERLVDSSTKGEIQKVLRSFKMSKKRSVSLKNLRTKFWLIKINELWNQESGQQWLVATGYQFSSLQPLKMIIIVHNYEFWQL